MTRKRRGVEGFSAARGGIHWEVTLTGPNSGQLSFYTSRTARPVVGEEWYYCGGDLGLRRPTFRANPTFSEAGRQCPDRRTQNSVQVARG